jgi:hypothetical protein
MSLTRRELDTMRCGAPGCDHTSHSGPMSVRGRCHPKAAVRVKYSGGELDVRCAECGERVVRIAVAPGSDA